MNKLTNAMKGFMKDFIEDESGLTAVEDAIAGGLVVGGMLGAFIALGDNATNQINALSCATTGGTWTAGTEATTAADGTVTPATVGSCA